MTTTNTKHTCESDERAFGRRVAGCPRCEELKAGAPARDGWQKSYYAHKAIEASAYRRHDCKESRCGIVCTAGEW